MDVFYYCKNFDADLAAGRLGALKSSADKVKELTEGQPDYIWAFGTPKGRKAELQLLGRLQWVDKRGAADSLAFDADSRGSVLFVDGGSDTAIAQVTDWAGRHFHKMRSARFQGTTGQEAMRGLPLKELEAIAARLTPAPLRSPAAA
jgi:hypothetical protein